jgi:hypothetical protein
MGQNSFEVNHSDARGRHPHRPDPKMVSPSKPAMDHYAVLFRCSNEASGRIFDKGDLRIL